MLVWYSQSLQKIYKYFIEITFLSHFCLFNTLFHVYPTTARMKNVAGLVKRHLAGIFLTVVAPWQRDFRINSCNGQIVGLLSDWYSERWKWKPVFLVDDDDFGSSIKPARSLWLTNVDIYKAIGASVPSQSIKGIQHIREMWRIYIDNEEDRRSMLVQVLVLRGRQVPSPLTKSLQPGRTQPDTIRINIENLPLSDNNGPTVP